MKKIRLFIAIIKAIADYAQDKKLLAFYEESAPDLYEKLKKDVILEKYINRVLA